MEETIKAILPLTAEFEGFSAKVYKCPAGFNTLGYGRNIEANPLSEDEKAKLNADGTVSQATARLWLKEHLERCYNDLARSFSWFEGLDVARKGALVDLCFNIGLRRLMGFKKALRCFEKQDFLGACRELEDSNWHKQVKRRGVKIVEIVQLGVVK